MLAIVNDGALWPRNTFGSRHIRASFAIGYHWLPSSTMLTRALSTHRARASTSIFVAPVLAPCPPGPSSLRAPSGWPPPRPGSSSRTSRPDRPPSPASGLSSAIGLGWLPSPRLGSALPGGPGLPGLGRHFPGAIPTKSPSLSFGYDSGPQRAPVAPARPGLGRVRHGFYRGFRRFLTRCITGLVPASPGPELR